MSTRPTERPVSRARLQTHEAFCACTTTRPLDFVDLTDDIQGVVEASRIRSGRVTLFSPTDRCPIVVNERETGLLEDIRGALARVRRADGNGFPARVGAKSVVLPVVEGKVPLGTWQRILLLELDRATDRSVLVQIVGE